MHLLGLHGPANAGKSTVAQYLVEQYGFAEVSFAAPLYRGVATMLGIDIGELLDRAKKEAAIAWLGASPRYLLQTLGTEWGRKLVREDLWLVLAARAIDKHRALGRPGVAVSDVRFDNEAEFILARGGELWGIQRPSRPTLVRAHASEAGISTNYPSRGLINAAGFPALHARVDTLLDELEARLGAAAPGAAA
jgi:hypothetical protein